MSGDQAEVARRWSGGMPGRSAYSGNSDSPAAMRCGRSGASRGHRIGVVRPGPEPELADQAPGGLSPPGVEEAAVTVRPRRLAPVPVDDVAGVPRLCTRSRCHRGVAEGPGEGLALLQQRQLAPALQAMAALPRAVGSQEAGARPCSYMEKNPVDPGKAAPSQDGRTWRATYGSGPLRTLTPVAPTTAPPCSTLSRSA